MIIDTGRILDDEAREERARNLAANNLNGLRRLYVRLLPALAPTEAWLDVELHNALQRNTIVAAIGGGTPAHVVFPILGGSRLRGGSGSGQVRVTQVQAGAGANELRLRVVPIGDYSTYRLGLNFAGIDPMFAELGFKFRPACFDMNCSPAATTAPPEPAPDIDYLAKDFDSFKHVLICAMRERVPGWEPTSEADLDQVLIDLIAADADELSDFQDRVVNESRLGSARKRVSLARHARLMDYHLHQGNQASTWLAVEVSAPGVVDTHFVAWTGTAWQAAGSQLFAVSSPLPCDPRLNALSLYTWGGSVTALEAGCTEADLALPQPSLNPLVAADANLLRDLINAVPGRSLLLEQALNPNTGTANGRDPGARQRLPLDGAAQSVFDPMTGHWCVRVRWRSEHALRRRYCFISRCGLGAAVTDVSRFHGNLLPADHGRPHLSVLRPSGAPLAIASPDTLVHVDEAHYERRGQTVLAPLPKSPLAWRDTPPGGLVPPRSSLQVTVDGFVQPWAEQSDLIESDAGMAHFQVETDELQRSRLRFGDGINARALPPDAVIRCRYQVGRGLEGNVGADSLVGFERAIFPNVARVWNPFDAVNGRDPEPVAQIRRRVPEAYRERQLRAITLHDYARRAEEIPEVAHAHARHAWTGSWRTVRVAIDPRGGIGLPAALRERIAAHLDAVRLIGEDIEVRPAAYVPLDVFVRVCADPAYWPADLRDALERELGDGHTADGRPGLFHPDQWTFGQAVHASQIIGRALSVQGVARVLRVSLRRLNGMSGPSLATINGVEGDPPAIERLPVQAHEIIVVANDPGQLERGRLNLEILGGRR